MLTFLAATVLVSASILTIFVLLIVGDMETLRKRFARVHRVEMPLINSDGKIIQTREELEAELEYMKEKLVESQMLLKESKVKVVNARKTIEQLSRTTVQAQKHYLMTRDEVTKLGLDCEWLETMITTYSGVNEELQKQEWIP